MDGQWFPQSGIQFESRLGAVIYKVVAAGGTFRLALSGDMTDGDDVLLLSGDEQGGTDALKLSGDEAV